MLLFHGGGVQVSQEDIFRVMPLCLRHRLRKDPLEQIDSGEKVRPSPPVPSNYLPVCSSLPVHGSDSLSGTGVRRPTFGFHTRFLFFSVQPNPNS